MENIFLKIEQTKYLPIISDGGDVGKIGVFDVEIVEVGVVIVVVVGVVVVIFDIELVVENMGD